MRSTGARRVRGILFLVAALLALALIVYFVAVPNSLSSLHPLPLTLLLVATAAIALWQANEYLRGP